MDSRKFWNKFMGYEGGLPVEEPYKHFYITDALIFFRDHANGSWLIEAIYRNLPRRKIRERDIVLCDLTVNDGIGTLVMKDQIFRDEWTLTMKFRDVSLPIDHVPLYCQPVESDWVLMTPHESLTMIVHRATEESKR